MKLVLAALPLALAGCLDPLVDDTAVGGDRVLPAGTVLPRVADDPVLAAQVATHDGVDGVVPLLGGFAAGAPYHGWDFGPTPTFAAPVFVPVRRTADGFERVAHNTLVETLPGDRGYSPYWSLYLVYVTDRWQGEVIPSVAALDDALARGLIEPPEAQPVAVNCPTVAADVTLEVGGGAPPALPNGEFNVRGRTVPYFDFGLLPLLDRVAVPEVARYRLRREGGEPLSEPVRGVDMTGDGDTVDSNDILDVDPASALTSPLCRTVEVVVPVTTGSIDTSGDDTMADLRTATQLFAPGPVVGTVISFRATDDLRNCVVQRQVGGL
ncbi:MAG: hypothetical protein IPL61_20275 [Myxococcales bacterium]|nr:hypothetical protein [Myxococcales bacterium]